MGGTILCINTVPLFRSLQNGTNQSTVTLKYQIKVRESVCSNTVMAMVHLQGINLVAKNFLEYSSFVLRIQRKVQIPLRLHEQLCFVDENRN